MLKCRESRMIKIGIACFIFITSFYVSAKTTLVVLNWPDYLPPQIIKNFEAQYDASITQIYFESDERKDYLLNTHQGENYDVVVSSMFRAKNYQANNWLESVSQTDIPNIKHVSPTWFKEYKNSDQTCVPYVWGSIGIIYNADVVKTPMQTWAHFFTDPLSPNIRIKLLSDSRDVIGSALISLGYSANEENVDIINSAGKLLFNRLENIDSFGALELSERSLLIQDKITMAMAYNGDAMLLTKLDNRLKFVVPKEGTSLWLDCLTVMKKSKNKKLAYQFINFIHEPKNAAHITKSLYYASTNETAKQYIPKEILDDPQVYIKKETLDRSEFYKILKPVVQKNHQTIYSQLNFLLDKPKQ